METLNNHKQNMFLKNYVEIYLCNYQYLTIKCKEQNQDNAGKTMHNGKKLLFFLS